MGAPSLSVQVDGGPPVTGDNFNTYEQTCDTPSDLRNFNGVQGIQVYMRGYNSPGDGGQGPFYWNVNGTAVDDNGVTTIVPFGNTVGCWTRLSGVALASNYVPMLELTTANITAAAVAFTIPAKGYIQQIIISNTTANAVTGGINLGTTSGAADIVSAIPVGANALVRVTDAELLRSIFSLTASQLVFISAGSAWNSASLTLYLVYGQLS